MLNNSILVIDDDKILINLISKTLKAEGYRIFIATNGQDGFKIHKNEKPVLTILDIKMPGMNGVAFLEQLNLKPSDHSFVIVLTAYADNETKEKCYNLGISIILKNLSIYMILKGL